MWAESGIYEFDRTRDRPDVYSIDTPPPTVSGDLHPGHCCSYSHTDFIARYQRMRGREVFYPMGWDDNGLNVERRVQIMLGITCDPTLAYDPDFVPTTAVKGAATRPVSRRNFIESCAVVTEQLEARYFELWSDLGLSVDWSRTYRTIGAHAVLTSQHGFLDLAERGLVYRTEAPTLWDVDLRTAVAQAELQERQIPGEYHRLSFARAGDTGGPVEVDTTRPELLAACVALVVHPGDARFADLVGTPVRTPLFDVEVPVLAHRLADPDKGTGVAMVCTFGDTTDVTWWRELSLPVRSIIGKDGRVEPGPPSWLTSPRAIAAYARLAGRTARQARRESIEMLADAGRLVGPPRAIEHPVKFWENGSTPLEIVTNDQWFVRLPDRQTLLARGRSLNWWPEFMGVRYENWVNGLVGDWNITRQRYFGVPFPAWYPVDGDGRPDLTAPIFATREQLPVDPTIDVPPGFDAAQRGAAGGFTADPDVMDTWATSSLTPRIVGHAVDDPDLFARVYPMDLRPQAHEIIRTWLFYTVVRAEHLDGTLPWSNVAISGFVTDPDRKKLSKSQSNADDDPQELIAAFGADAVRYWAAGGRPGLDVTFDRNRMKVGRRLATKILNVTRLVTAFPCPSSDVDPSPLDRLLDEELAVTVTAVTEALEQYDHSRALATLETFFWFFCDDYVELVKSRAYAGDASAVHTLRDGLETLLRLFAPFLPFVTEEAWSGWRAGSVHRASWPMAAAAPAPGEGGPLALAAELLRRVRGAKTRARVGLATPVSTARIVLPVDQQEAFEVVRDDLVAAGCIADLRVVAGDEIAVELELAPAATAGETRSPPPA
jgi:valyl-tRNA synthetase